MKHLLLFYILFALAFELAAKEPGKNNPVLKTGKPSADKDRELLAQKLNRRVSQLAAASAGEGYIGMSPVYLAALYPENFSLKKRGSITDYTAHSWEFRDYSKDSLIVWDQLSELSEMGDISVVELNYQYHLTSTDVHNFFSQTTYGKQFLNGTKLMVGVGVGMMGVLMVAPRSITRWEDNFVDKAKHNLDRAFTTPPVWDQDNWAINYIGHPYAGGIYYNAVRAQGANVPQSFIFSAFISTGWEYVYEGVAERPSIQDLVATPVIGSILGELTHQATLRMKKNGCNLFEKVFILVFNPAHLVFKGYHP